MNMPNTPTKITVEEFNDLLCTINMRILHDTIKPEPGVFINYWTDGDIILKKVNVSTMAFYFKGTA